MATDYADIQLSQLWMSSLGPSMKWKVVALVTMFAVSTCQRTQVRSYVLGIYFIVATVLSNGANFATDLAAISK